MLAGAFALAALSVALDFTSAILSILSDGLLMAGAGFLVFNAYHSKVQEVRRLKSEVSKLEKLISG